MSFEFDSPAPPTARVTTVMALKPYARGQGLHGIDDETLVEIHVIGCMITDDDVLLRVSATATGLSGTAHTAVVIPASWYQQLPRMRELLEIPDDLRNLTTSAPPLTTVNQPKRRGRRPKIALKSEEQIGNELAERWRRTSTSHLQLGDSTREWFSMCEEQIPDILAVEYLRARKLLSNLFIRKEDRKVIATFCEQLVSNLTAENDQGI